MSDRSMYMICHCQFISRTSILKSSTMFQIASILPLNFMYWRSNLKVAQTNKCHKLIFSQTFSVTKFLLPTQSSKYDFTIWTRIIAMWYYYHHCSDQEWVNSTDIADIMVTTTTTTSRVSQHFWSAQLS